MNPHPLKEKIAVVGMGCIFPDASNPDEFWQNILAKKVSIAKVSDAPPGSRAFDVDAHYRPELHGASDKQDKTYTDLSALVEGFRFDPRRYRIPPTVADQMDENQKVALASADQALEGVKTENVSKDRISVFIGSSMVGELHHEFQKRIDFQRFEHHLSSHPVFAASIPEPERTSLLREIEGRCCNRGLRVTEDTAPGILPNILAARIASVFDFHGHAYTVDAACASGIAAIICGVQHLNSGESDMVVCGAADMLAGEIGRIYFSGIGALSPDGSFPFDERANGFVIGQGGGVLVLKRLSDALRHGDTIHAVLAGYGQTSDGKGKAIAAPNPVWQAKTLESSMTMAGFHPDTVELIEAHGTATKVGDASEVEALKNCFGNLGSTSREACSLGSVKSNIGHLKSAAGIAGAIKAIQAIRHRTIPPTANCSKVNPKLALEGSPFRVATESRPWEPKSHPRRAGVSAFGFGGANYHLSIEEFRPDIHVAAEPATSEVRAEYADRLTEIVLLSGANRQEVRSKLDALLQRIGTASANASAAAIEESYRADASDPCRVAIVFDSPEQLRERAEAWKATDSDHALRLLRAKGICHGEGSPRGLDQMAFLFPGQGSQYADMLLGLLEHFPCTRPVAARIDAWWEKRTGTKVSDLISSRSRGKAATDALLKDTRHTHPALLHANMVASTLLQDMGVRPAWMIGHSAGEVVALAASGRMDLAEALHLMDQRSRAFVGMKTTDFGKMAAARCDRRRLEPLVASSGLPVAIANINSPEQVIVSGPSDAIDEFCRILDKEGIRRAELNVSHAFHSPVVAPAATSFGKAIRATRFRRGHARVLANEICAEYPEADKDVRALLESQVTGSVDFCGGIQELHARGVRLFVEVGPGSVLGNLATAILKDKDATVLSINHRNGDTLESLQKALAALFAEGIPLNPIPPARRARQPDPVSAPTAIAAKAETAQDEIRPARRVVYSGVSIGLPGSFRKSFQDDNFDRLFEGHNFIEPVPHADKRRLADMRVQKVEKTASGPVFQVLETLEDVIQLAGRIGKIDPLGDYSIDPKDAETATTAVLHAVAAGYEALRDAGIPLVREYTRTASGSLLPDRWALPQEMQKRTGVIFAHGFPMVEPVAAEVSRHVASSFGGRLRGELVELYQELIGKLRDQESKAFLSDWFSRNHHALSGTPGKNEVYTFNHRFIQQISALGNNRLAAQIGALGPNFQLNAACSSTSTSITLAEEMIRSGRADRFVVVGADDPTSEVSFPYIGAGFLSTGAATSEADVYKAALPFDLRRNGMIMGSGAVGIVVEAAEHVEARGMSPVCELLGSHVFNTAGHHARLDVPRYAEELDEFLERIESTHSVKREDIAPRLVYVSHETYTPARGGCSESEANALRKAFGDRFSQIEVTNTKGLTGHTMGASIEDAVAAKSLQTGKVPPVANHKVEDPALSGLKLSRGGSHSREYALRMAAGFGSQGNYILLRKCSGPADRVLDPARRSSWLATISGQASPEVEIHGRLLRIRDKVPGAVLANRPSGKQPSDASRKSLQDPTPSAKPTAAAALPPVATQVATPAPKASTDSDVRRIVLQVVSEVTGYPPEMLETDMEIEADLGVDTVKQATILAMLGERFGNHNAPDFQLSAYPTIGHLVGLFDTAKPAERANAPTTDLPATTTVTTPAQKASTDSDVLRHGLVLEDAPLGLPSDILATSRILVIADTPSTAQAFAKRISNLCKEAIALELSDDASDTKACIAAKADIWIDLGGLDAPEDLESMDPDSVARVVSRFADLRFRMAKDLETSGANKPSRILCVCGPSESPLGGLLRGFHLSLGKEWGIKASLLDTPRSPDLGTLAEWISTELDHVSVEAHVDWSSGHRRAWRCRPLPESPVDAPLELDSSDTVLVTGGGNGIAARVLLAMAKRYPCGFVVVGRTEIDNPAEYVGASWDDRNLASRKEELRQTLSKGGKKVAPATLEREFASFLKRRETARTLDAIRNSGREVAYIACDVCDPDNLGKRIAELGRRITGVIHAAGIDISRPLSKKSPEEFAAVHRVKTLGAIHLARIAPPGSLKFFFTFTSISGVFGNAAQLDYAAGNGFLDGWARHLAARYPGLRARGLAWSGWSETGMAWRNDWVRANAEGTGLHLIPPEQGCAAALREFDGHGGTPTILHKGLGGMLDQGWGRSESLPLIDSFEEDGTGKRIAKRKFSPARDELLNQHRLNTTPLMPGVGSMEFMAEFLESLSGSAPHVRFRKLSFSDAFKFHRDGEREARIEATRSDDGDSWDMVLKAKFESRIGGMSEDREFSRSTVWGGVCEPPAFSPWETSPSAKRIAYSRLLADLDRIRNNVVFGPLFHESRNPRCSEDVEVVHDAKGLRTTVILPNAQFGNPRYPLDRFRLNPCFLDSLHQSGVIHGVLETGSVHLPVGAEEFVVLGKQDRPGTYVVEVIFLEARQDLRVYDIVLRDAAGNPCAWALGSTYRKIGA